MVGGLQAMKKHSANACPAHEDIPQELPSDKESGLYSSCHGMRPHAAFIVDPSCIAC